MKSVLTIVTLLMVTGSVLPTMAAPVYPNRTNSIRSVSELSQGRGVLVADAWDDYQRRRHLELDQQINSEMNQSHNRRLSQKEKERIIRDAHKALDKELDREEEDWRERYSDSRDRDDDRYDRRRDDDRYDRRHDDDRYDNRNDDRYNDRYNDREVRERYRNFDENNNRDRRLNGDNGRYDRRYDQRDYGRGNRNNRNINYCSPQNPYDCYNER
ncbi:MAG: hypothetical protein ACRC8A_08100 [Microcoleaceae cyanobacterium]